MVKDNHPIHNAFSTLTQESLDDIVKSFQIDPRFKPFLPSKDQTINISLEGPVGVYNIFFESGL